jgi:hypothetical protein
MDGKALERKHFGSGCFQAFFILIAAPAIWTSGAADPLAEWHLASRVEGSNAVFDIAHGKNQFVAVGDHGAVLTSSDADIWTLRSTVTSNQLATVAFGKGLFVAIANPRYFNDATSSILTSEDGVQWTTQTNISGLPLVGPVFLPGLIFGGERFVAVGYQLGLSWGVAVTSTDGTNWTYTDGVTDNGLYNVAYGSRRFVATGGRILNFPFRNGAGTIATSDDGVTWTNQSNSSGGDLVGAAYGNGLFIATGYRKDPYLDSVVLKSLDAVHWNYTSTNREAAGDRNVAYGGGSFVAVGSGGVVSSTDGVLWTRRFGVTNTSATAVAYGAGRFVVGFNTGQIAYSGPFSPQEELRFPVSGVVVSTNGTRLQLETPPDFPVEVQAGSNLGQWSTLGLFTNSTPDALEILDSEGLANQRFYRAELLGP